MNPADLTATAARALIGSRALSPVDLMEACIERIETLDPVVNAMVGRRFDEALVDARLAAERVARGDPLGPLHGVPVAIKDIQNVVGLPTTAGSIGLKDRMPEEDSGIVARIRAAGGIVIGKTNVPEFAASCESAAIAPADCRP